MPRRKGTNKAGAKSRTARGSNQSQKQKIQNRPKTRTAGGVTVHMSQCADEYLRALTVPFSTAKACIPDTICMPSMKTKTTARGTFATNAAGFGFIAINPWSMVHSDVTTTANGTASPVVASNSSYANTFVPQRFDSTVTDVAYTASNSIFSRTQLTNTGADRKQFRLVGCGLRVRYIGTELNRAGRLVMFRSRNNTPPPGTYNLDNTLRDNYFHTSAVDRQWKEITYFPSRTEDISYGYYDDPSTATTVEDYRIMACLVNGLASSNMEFEVDALFEIVGGFYAEGITTTPSHSDPTGMGAIMSAIPNTLKATGSALYGAVASGARKALAYAASGVITVGARAIGSYLGGPVGGAVGGYSANLLTQRATVEEID